MGRFIDVLNIVFSVLNYFGIKIQVGHRIPWKHVMRAVKKLDPDIRKYNPDVIIALADGMVVAGIIATNMSFSCFLPYYTLGVDALSNQDRKKSIMLLGK